MAGHHARLRAIQQEAAQFVRADPGLQNHVGDQLGAATDTLAVHDGDVLNVGVLAEPISTSASSMRTPLILTCRSRRPANSISPVSSIRPRSPVRYTMSLASSLKGFGMKHCAVRSGRLWLSSDRYGGADVYLSYHSCTHGTLAGVEDDHACTVNGRADRHGRSPASLACTS